MKTKWSYIMLLFVAVCCALPSCSDDEEALKASLNAPNTSLTGQSYNKLAFTWDKVANAIQYGYVFTNPSGKVIGEGTTADTKVSFTGLQPNTEYTLNVWAFPSLQSDYSTSPAFTMKGTTDPLKPIDAPAPTYSQQGKIITITWEAVSNASSYTYTFSGPGITETEEVETTETTVSFSNLEVGDYEFEIYANSTTGGYEPKSPSTTLPIIVEPIKDWSALGEIAYADEAPIPGKIIYNFSTDTYTIKNWMGVDGYDLNFQVTADGISIDGEEYSGYFTVETGLEDNPYLYLYPSGKYSSFDGDMDEGDFWVGCYDSNWAVWDYYDFSWNADTSHPTIDQVCGSYYYYDWGYEYYTTWGTWNTFDYARQPATITKTDDQTVYFSTLLSYPGFEDCGFEATYDPITLTFTVPIQNFADWYILGLENNDYSNGTGPTEGITAYLLPDGGIEMADWVVYYDYDGWYCKYFAYTGSYWMPAAGTDNNTAAAAQVAAVKKRMSK